jgi:outer membrane immunogenic protein
MKRILIGIAAIASLFAATGVFAADLAARTYTKAPVIVDPGYNWTGFYAGLNGGYSWGRANSTFATTPIFPIPIPVPALGSGRQDVDGGLGGGQVGYNWQVNRTWLVGLEADIQWSGERASRSFTSTGPRYGSNAIGVPVGAGADFSTILTQTSNIADDLQWFATFRGRAGFLADPQTLLYATGGLAVGEFKYSSQTTTSLQIFTGLTGPQTGTFALAGTPTSSSDTRVGWTVGAGVERKFSSNWSGKLEYLYLDLGTKTYFAGTVDQADVSFHDHIFRAGINYAFNPAPVVAKY